MPPAVAAVAVFAICGKTVLIEVQYVQLCGVLVQRMSADRVHRYLCSCPALSILGTPSESSWPNVTDLDDWNVGFPNWPRVGLAREYKDLEEFGINMLEVRRRV